MGYDWDIEEQKSWQAIAQADLYDWDDEDDDEDSSDVDSTESRDSNPDWEDAQVESQEAGDVDWDEYGRNVNG